MINNAMMMVIGLQSTHQDVSWGAVSPGHWSQGSLYFPAGTISLITRLSNNLTFKITMPSMYATGTPDMYTVTTYIRLYYSDLTLTQIAYYSASSNVNGNFSGDYDITLNGKTPTYFTVYTAYHAVGYAEASQTQGPLNLVTL